MLEPGEDSEDSEDNFYKYRPFFRQLQNRYKKFDENNYGSAEQVKLLKGVLDRNAIIPKQPKKKQGSLSDGEMLTDREAASDIKAEFMKDASLRQTPTMAPNDSQRQLMFNDSNDLDRDTKGKKGGGMDLDDLVEK